jgi:hypothetical protein
MARTKVTAILLAIVVVAALAPGAASAAPTTRSADGSVVGWGTWVLGTARASCDRDLKPNATFEFEDQCTYQADSAPSNEQPEDRCIEFADETIVAGCRAVLEGSTKTTSRIPDVCTQGGLLDGSPSPEGQVTVHSAALNKSYAVPVTITLHGSFATVYGSRRVDAARVGQIVVEGQFIWNLQGEQKCPIQGTEPTTGIWQGHYTFLRDGGS